MRETYTFKASPETHRNTGKPKGYIIWIKTPTGYVPARGRTLGDALREAAGISDQERMGVEDGLG